MVYSDCWGARLSEANIEAEQSCSVLSFSNFNICLLWKMLELTVLGVF